MNFKELEQFMFLTLSKWEELAENASFGHFEDWKLTIKPSKNPNNMGCCYYGSRRINICPWVLEYCIEDDVIDTLLHECAHALAGDDISPKGRIMKHGVKFRKWARRLGAAPRAKAKVTLKPEYKGQSLDALRGTKSKASKGPKYYVVYINYNGFEIMGSCNRRLKNLSSRYYKNKPFTKGRLWLIRSEHLAAAKNCTSTVENMAFR